MTTKDIRHTPLSHFRHGVLVGLSMPPARHPPGESKVRNLLGLRDRSNDVPRFVHDLKVPSTSNQGERDLRPSHVQQNTSGRLTGEQPTRDRYTIRGYVSTAAKHGLNTLAALRNVMTGQPALDSRTARTH